jgi:hypothetical protein
MSRFGDLRQRAEFCRQAAQVPTEGGSREDRVLLIIADRLEREASELEAHYHGQRDGAS